MKHIGMLVTISLLVCGAHGGVRGQSITKYCAVGGSTNAAGGSMSVKGSIGQAVIGLVATADRQTSQGFWQGSPCARPSRVEGSIPSDLTLLSNAPNPFAGETTLRFALPAASTVELRIVDLRGAVVDVRRVEGRVAGYNEYRYHAGSLPPGAYSYSLTNGNRSQTGTMTILR